MIVLAVGALGSCDRKQPVATLRAPAPMMAMARQATPDAAGPRIAYSHRFTLDLPSGAVQARQQHDVATCLAAGCTVLETQLNDGANGVVNGSISIRIAPEHYQAFADSLAAPPARLVSHTETAEDKTVPLLDVEKRLEAQTALRDRLHTMLQQTGVSVADLLSIEKELANVQGEIESETAQRDYLRTITGTVRVDVSYVGVLQPVGSFDFSPVRLAVDGFLQILIGSLGVMIDTLAWALPWLPVVALIGWGVRRLVRRRRA